MANKGKLNKAKCKVLHLSQGNVNHAYRSGNDCLD